MPLGTPLQVFGGEPVDEAAFLSASAYASDLQSHLANEFPKNPNNGWTLLKASDLDNLPGIGADGYYKKTSIDMLHAGRRQSEESVAFAATKGNTVAIALRGTTLNQLQQDLNAAKSNPVAHYNNVLPFINEVLKYASAHHYKVLVTGHSFGGQAAELFAVNPKNGNFSSPGKDELGNAIGAVDFHNLQPSDISVITFEAPGIPKNAYDSNAPLIKQNRVFEYYNTQDPVYYVLTGSPTVANPFAEGYVHLGDQAQRPFYEAEPQNALDILKVHNDTYQNYTEALSGFGQPYPFAAPILSKYVGPDANFIFGEAPGQHATAKINASSVGISQKPNVFISLGGNEEMDGGPGANVFEVLNPAWPGQADTGPGRHLLVTSRLSNPGAGDSNNVFIIEGGNTTIAGINLSKDAFWLPTFTNEPAVGHLGSSGTVIDFTGMDQKPASLYLQDIDFSSASLRSQYAPWLQWTGSSTT